MKKHILVMSLTIAALGLGASGCALIDEVRGTDKKNGDKARAKKEQAGQAEQKEQSNIPPDVASGLNDVEKQEMESVYKKMNSDSKATSKRVFGGFGL